MPLASQIELPERYRVARHIASGGMASVWEAEDLLLGRTVAVKVLGAQFASDPSARERFQREARTAAQVSDQTNVVTIYDIGEHADDAFIVMEYFAGGTVADRLRAARDSGGERISRETTLRWLSEAAAGLDVAHAAGIVHRDVKPANLLLDAQGRLAVADFGIARLADDTQMTQTGQVLGTAAYISPEQALGQPATAASDRYALAVVAYELLTGSRPFAGGPPTAQALQHARDTPPRASQADPELPAAVDGVFSRGLAKDPARRPATASELVAALEEALNGGGAKVDPTRPIPVVEPTKPTRMPDPLPVAAIPPRPPAATPAPERAATPRSPAPERSAKPEVAAAAAAGAAAAAAGAPLAGVADAAATPPRDAEQPPVRKPPLPAAAQPAAAPAPSRQPPPPPQRPSAPRGQGAGAPRRGAPSWLPIAGAAFVVAAVVALVFVLASGSDPKGGDGRQASTKPKSERSRTASTPAAPPPATPASATEGQQTSKSSSTQGLSAVALNQRGKQLSDNGQYAAAVEPLRAAVAQYKADGDDGLNYAFALYNLAVALNRSGNPAEAVPLLRERLKFNNQTETVQAELDNALAKLNGGKAPKGDGKVKKNKPGKNDAG
jgi:serine/threonine-protein kinase